MSESAEPWNQPDEETKAAAEPIRRELEDALAVIDTPAKAEALAQRLEADALEREAVEVAEAAPQLQEASPEIQAQIAAETVEHAKEARPNEPVGEAAAAIEAIAAEAAALDGPAYEALVEAVQDVTNPALRGEPEKLERPRRYLRDTIMQ
ncbi:MAG: hypothetical protein ACRDIB_02720, partial [Ardenticatenaceae bacterium]